MTTKTLLVIFCFHCWYGQTLFAQNPGTNLSKTDEAAVRQLLAQYTDAWLKNDSAVILSLFEEKARLAPSGMCPIESIANIRQFWFPNDSSLTLIHGFDNDIIELSGEGDMAFSTQKTWLDWSYFKGKQKMGKEQRGYATTIFRKQNTGAWKIWRQTWTDVWSRPKPDQEVGHPAPVKNRWSSRIKTVKDFIAARQRKDETAYLKMLSPKMRVWYEEKKGEGQPWNPKSAWAIWDDFFNGQKTYGEFREDSNAVIVVVTETNDFFTLIERPASPVQLTWWFDKEGKIESYLVKSFSGNAVPDRLQEFKAWAKQQDSTALAYLMPDGRISPDGDRPHLWKKMLLSWRETLDSANNPEARIRQAIAAFSQLLMAGDWDAVAAAYTDDAKIFPPGQPVVYGRANIRAAWAASAKIMSHKITPSEIKINGSEAWDWGVYEGKSVDKDGKESVWKGKYVIVWKEVAPGDWKMYLDIWNRMPD
ncbi:MAG: YybH family protein [Saprospiraceae bacterium]